MHVPKNRGSAFLRFGIVGFSVAVGVLSFWLLGYILRDIDRIDGPNLGQMIEQRVPAELYNAKRERESEIDELNKRVAAAQGKRTLINVTIADSQQTINQLLELQRLTAEKEQPLTDEQQKALTDNLQLFLATQRESQALTTELISLNDELASVRKQLEANAEEIRVLSEPIQRDYQQRYTQHQWKLAFYKLGLLTPMLVVCGVVFMRYAGGTYAMLMYALAAAVSLRVLLVMHEHFPSIYFKYILIVLSLVICLVVLVRLLRLVAQPSRQWLLKQYREAYSSFFCPKCDYPIQRGPLRYAYWTKRSLKKHSLGNNASGTLDIDSAYTCPCCTTTLFEKCQACGGTRHSLLPACDKCGDVNDQPRAEEGSTTGRGE